MKRPRLTSLVAIGLFGAVLAWLLHQQTGIILASWSCAGAPSGIWLSGVIATLFLLACAGISGLGLRRARAGHITPEAARPRRFIAMISLMAGALFLFAIALQTAAALFLPGCIG